LDSPEIIEPVSYAHVYIVYRKRIKFLEWPIEKRLFFLHPFPGHQQVFILSILFKIQKTELVDKKINIPFFVFPIMGKKIAPPPKKSSLPTVGWVE
jgi:hypothetical protein